MSSEECTFATPSWLLQRIKSSWPDEWQKVVSCANQKPPMTLRVNTLKITRSEFIELLGRENIKACETSISPWGITLEKPRDISSIPGFSAGFCSVQDEAAQMAPLACIPFDGGRVLDACAAPGGKTTHLIETLKNIESVTAIDLPNRTRSINDNLNRLDQSAKVISADILNDKKWCDGELYDLILLDAPCSGTGVIKRHPDIRHHRRSSDISTYALQQSQLLSTLWPLLRTGGRLVYVTCSILNEENDAPIDNLIQKFGDVQVQDITIPTAIGTKNGQQLLPNNEHDGLFYASLAKV
ncbi:MAG: 16S rRNA (cytosine(967)-C(5))-methyltransferase [Proteobacteria bacterium]|nr:16S rRNA (cytosine(967)-C(5))-methyltransferase [Pseudomonadota bacterium]